MRISLSKKIAFFVGLLVLITALTTGLSALKFSVDTTLYEVKKTMTEYAKEASKHIETELDMRLNVLQEVALGETIQTMDWEMQKISLKNDVERLGYLDLAIVSLDGTASYDRQRPYYLSKKCI